MSSTHDDSPPASGERPSWSPTPSSYGQMPPDAPQPQHLQPGYPQQPYAAQQPSWPLAALPAGGYPPPPVWVPPVPVYRYAVWSRRVGGYLVDFAPSYVAMIPFWVGYVLFYLRIIQLSTTPPTAPDPAALFGEVLRPALVWMFTGFVLMLCAFGWHWYNRWLIAGRTGQSMGKRVVNTKLVAEVNGQPIGPFNAFLRDLLHMLDAVAYLGYLWPLWDAKRQTFADMIMKTVVIDYPDPGDPGQPTPASSDAHPYGPPA